MNVRHRRYLCILLISSHIYLPLVRADGLLDRLKAGRPRQLKQEYHTKEVHNGPPYDLTQVASMVDIVEEGILDDGTVVIKRPDVWSQARMTKYRQDFEKQMAAELTTFKAVLSARVARTDQASFENSTSLGASLAASGGRGRGGPAPIVTPQLAPQGADEFNKNQIELLKAQTAAFKTQSDAQVAAMTAATEAAKAQAAQAKDLSMANIAQLTPAAGTSAQLAQTDAFKLLGEKGAFQEFAENVSAGKLGLEPTVFLDEKKRYLDHLNELRRINLGDDNADTAGYSLSLVRLPVSIQPGEKTLKGHGAIMTVTARPEFRPDFLRTTYRNLVVQDIVDQFTPILFEILDRDLDKEYLKQREKLIAQERATYRQIEAINRQIKDVSENLSNTQKALEISRRKPPANALSDSVDPKLAQQELVNALGKYEADLKRARADLDQTKEQLRGNHEALQELTKRTLDQVALSKIPSTRLSSRPYPIAPTDMTRVFLGENLVLLANAIRQFQPTVRPRAAEIRAFLNQTAEPAFALLPRYEGMIDEITSAVDSHAFLSLPTLYSKLSGCLPNDLTHHIEDPISILCWSIAVDAGLLDHRLKEEMKRLAGQSGFQPECDIDSLFFYLSQPQPGAGEVFQAYVNARWPIICFALDPVTDQQNIADAFSMRRDLTLAVSFAFSTGKINFNQFNRFRRRIELDAETIALNRTVTTFAHGNETFGWRFYPRYQNPPQEASNLHVVANQLLRGGPGRDYQIKNSKLEAGQRELTAVIILPSFLPQVRFEVLGNWFGLTQPDDYTVPMARMVWQGQEVMKLRHALTHYCDPKLSRPGDLQRVLTKVDRVEQMLPMQTEIVNIPYENAQGGFDLFTPGLASLVPQLFGYDGVDLIEPNKDAAFFITGKNLSIHETKVVAGGRRLTDDQVELLSREVMRVVVPADFLATALVERDGRSYVEVVAGTPNGISNRLVIPIKLIKPKDESTDKKPKTGYTWKPVPDYVVNIRYTDSGVIDPMKPLSIFEFEGSPSPEIIVNTNRAFLLDPDRDKLTLVPASVTHMVMRLQFKDKDGKSVILDTAATKPAAPFGRVQSGSRAEIPFEANIRNPIRDALIKTPGGLVESRFPQEVAISVETFILVEGSSTAIKLDDTFSIAVKVRNAVQVAPVVPVLVPDAHALPPALPVLPSELPH